MQAIIQRVKSASVKELVTGLTVGEIGPGLFVLLGIAPSDTKDIIDQFVTKLSKLRILSDEMGKMNLSVLETKQEVLVVSQFTLLADTSKGNRPSFINAADPQKGKQLYERSIEKLKEMGINVASGTFGANMAINTVLDGPVTIIL